MKKRFTMIESKVFYKYAFVCFFVFSCFYVILKKKKRMMVHGKIRFNC